MIGESRTNDIDAPREFPFGPRLIRFFRYLFIASLLAAVISPVIGADPSLDFDRQVAPLLAVRCLECHQGADPQGGLDLSQHGAVIKGGESGPILAPGKPDESLLWERVSNGEMPPKKPLADDEKSLLRRWIESGARWGTSPIDPFRVSTSLRAGYDWWSLQPLGSPDLPSPPGSQRAQNPIDLFILSKLDAAGLKLSPPAERRTLIRRLTFDLTGLPPSPEDVAAFVADPDELAYEKLVDRLLASPRYGERWARHWLDLARFGESNGFEYDEPRQNAWPYRDWVIDALNRDMPYDAFARLQLAGDILEPNNPEAIKATGFLVAGPYDTAGQVQQSAAMKAVVRQDELEDIIGTVSQTFLGLTVNCARCHDHKFDPVRQKEYYQLTSALGGVRHGERDVASPAELAEFQQRLAASRRRADDLAARINAIDEPIRSRILSERKATGSPHPKPPAPLARWEFDRDLRDAVGQLDGAASGNAEIREGGLKLAGKDAFVATAPLTKDLRAKTLEAWVSLDNLRQSGGGVMTVQSLDGGVFDSIVFAEREPGRWMAGSNGFVRTQGFDGPKETEADKRVVHVAIVYEADGTIAGYRDGQPYGKPYRAAPPAIFAKGQAQILFGMRHGPPGGNRMLKGVIERASLYDRALTPDEVAASAGKDSDFVAESRIVARLAPADAAKRRALREELTQCLAATPSAPKRMAYAVSPRQPEPAHILARGDIRQRGPIVAAGGVAAVVGLPADFQVAPDAPEAAGRVALARWLTHPRNPLFARVIVNRLWHYHFGAGLVETPNDFGFNGGRPSHPELLDWLAKSLIERGFSLKQLHREIVLSNAYRQASTFVSSSAQIDASNRLLWRMNPRRLEAEAVRDAALAVADDLNLARGGPGFQDSRVVLRSGSYSYEPADPIGAEFNRRSVYRVWARGGRSGLLDAFDCPDPSVTAPKRAVTITPLQALTLLNSSFILRTADRFADRVIRDAGPSAGRQISRAYQLAYGRASTDAERGAAERVVTRHGLSVITRAILNSNEFLYVD